MDGQKWIHIVMDGLKRIHRVILEVSAPYKDALGKLTELNSLYSIFHEDWMDGQEWIHIVLDGLKQIHRVILEVSTLYTVDLHRCSWQTD